MMRKLVLSWFFWLLAIVGYAQTPSTASSNIVFSDTLCNRVTVSWSPGDGQGRIVIARKGTPVTSSPSDNTYYIPRDTFNTVPSQFATGDEHVVYNGSGNSVIVYGLEANTTYHFAVFEYNGSGSVFSYLTSGEPTDSVTTEYIFANFLIDKPHQCDSGNVFGFSENVQVSSGMSGASLTYLWNFGDGTTASGTDVSHSYANYGIYSPSLTVSTPGCIHQVVRKDTVAPVPKVDFQLTPDSLDNTQTQCFYYANGRQHHFYFTNKMFNPPLGTRQDQLFVTWDYGDGFKSYEYHGNHSYDEPGLYNVRLIVSISKQDTLGVFCTDSLDMLVRVKPRPLDSTRIHFSDTSMCLNYNRFHFANRTGISGQGKWFFGDGDSALGDSAYHSYASAGLYNVKFEILDDDGCYDEYDRPVEVVPQPNNFFIGLDPNYCLGDPAAFLTPNLTGGTFEGTHVSAVDSTFSPLSVGRHTIRYIYQVNDCIDTFEAATYVRPQPNFELGPDTSICEGSSFQLSIRKDTCTIMWDNGSPDSFRNVSAEGLYWVEKNSGWCKHRDSIRVTTIVPPSVTLGSDSTLCGDQYRFVDVTADEGEYFWNDNYQGATRTINQTGYYKVVVRNKCGEDSAEVDLIVLPFPCDLYVPNAFSPDDNGLNDVFRATGNVEVTSMMIFNRWGELLFEQYGGDPAWDGYYMGNRVQTGNYFFIITYQLPVGESTKPQTVSGTVYVLY